jgi:rhamnose utilization protein RhaD (predicted bifunctional aldolase and dehydrogenase)
MSQLSDVLQSLVSMSRHLAEPERDYVILAEGNTSAKIDDTAFWVKASGVGMPGIGEDGFVAMDTARVLALLDGGSLNDEQIKNGLAAARVDPQATRRPSVETILHALALTIAGAHFVGHTHPTAINAILCARGAEEAVMGRLFPDEIVVCGPAPVFVPYTDPGLPLAAEVRRRILAHLDAYGEAPKVILMQNHGLVALGQSAAEVEAITAMAVKTARVRLGTFALGGPNALSREAVARIHTRPDELFRRKELNK